MKKTKRAFTLAEVLISLTIIGVIAAITVPALVQRTNKQEYVSALQKAYSTLSQAVNIAIAENGSPKGSWSTQGGVYNMFRKYLNNTKECANVNIKGCVPQKIRALRDNNTNGGSIRDDRTDYQRRLLLADGMQLMIDQTNLNCGLNNFDNNGANGDACSWIMVDVNGPKKPNQFGRDVFSFFLKENGLYPAGCDRNVCVTKDSGYGCACRVLREGAMNY